MFRILRFFSSSLAIRRGKRKKWKKRRKRKKTETTIQGIAKRNRYKEVFVLLYLSLSAFSLTLKKTQASSFRSKPKKTSPPPVSTVVTIRRQSLHVKSKPKTREGPKFTPVAERKRGGRKRVSERHEKNPAVSTETQVFCGKRWAVRYLMAFV